MSTSGRRVQGSKKVSDIVKKYVSMYAPNFLSIHTIDFLINLILDRNGSQWLSNNSPTLLSLQPCYKDALKFTLIPKFQGVHVYYMILQWVFNSQKRFLSIYKPCVILACLIDPELCHNRYPTTGKLLLLLP